jgi:hypothetical protein
VPLRTELGKSARGDEGTPAGIPARIEALAVVALVARRDAKFAHGRCGQKFGAVTVER